jgi:hypothetical protein
MADDPFATLPAALRSFAAQNRLDPGAVRSGGRLSLTLDARYRVNLQATTHDRIALTSQLLVLPSGGPQKLDEALGRLMRTAAGMLQQHPSTLAIDTRAQALVLQQTVPANSDCAGIETAVADFTNALAFWSKVCATEAAAL